MRRTLAIGLMLVLSLGLVHGENGKQGKEKHGSEHIALKPGDLKWGPAPPALPTGAQFAVLVGDPGKAGMFTIRAKMPDGYTVPPHWHPTDENVTVLQGTLLIGASDKIDVAHAKELTAGSFMHMPKEMRHFAKAKGETIIQVHGMGPFEVTYVNAGDDPRTKK
jgi:quercetin dioxygenase-like cupin family protein